MENTQFPILNAIFGGKFAADALANGKAGSQGEEASKDAGGFFTFIEGLLKPATEADEDAGAPLLGSIVSGQTPFKPLDESAIRDALEGKIAASETSPAKRTGPFTVPVNSHMDSAASANAAVNLDALLVDPATDTEQLPEGIALALEGEDADIRPKTSLPVHAAAPSNLSTPKAFQHAADILATPLSSGPVGTVELDLDLGEPRGDGASRFDALAFKAQIDKPGLVLPQQANAAIAVAEHAAPDALAHSAVAGDEAAGMDTDRFSASRLEVATHGADRNAHLNPIRDQIVAAVSTRPGENKLEIRLDPPELGKVLIGFDRDGADIVRAVISAESPDTLDLMRRHADVFQRALEAQGFENLDLHFADKQQGESADDAVSEDVKNFQFADEPGMSDASAASTMYVDGRLDRRL